MSDGHNQPSASGRTAKGRLSDFIQFTDETILWTASIILLNHLQRPEIARLFEGKRVLELGSGLGHLGMGLYNLGAHVTCTERPKELPHLIASIEAQKAQPKPVLESALQLLLSQKAGEAQADSVAAAQAVEASKTAEAPEGTINHTPSSRATVQGSITAVALEWGQEGYERSPLSTQALGSFDYIICSELYYIERLFPELLWTLRRFAGPDTEVWSIFIDRPFSFMFFSLLHDEGVWDVTQVEGVDLLGLDPELECHLHQIRLKPGQTTVAAATPPQ